MSSSNNNKSNKSPLQNQYVPMAKRAKLDIPLSSLRTNARIVSRASSSISDTTTSSTFATVDAELQARIDGMNERAKAGISLTEHELNDIMISIENLNSLDENKEALKDLLLSTAHLSHKDWSLTEQNGDKLGNVLQLVDMMKEPQSERARQMLKRILTEGNWDGATEHAAKERPSTEQPWAVLVTGVNGIRKTTSIYQPWFPKLLQEALVVPSGADQTETVNRLNINCLPVGTNSFFRQLDHMIATLCNQDFKILYTYARDLLLALEDDEPESDNNTEKILSKDPPAEIVQKYSNLKAAIFTRYRTLSELLGAHLLKEAQKDSLNCLLETSGKDVAMFHYVDHFFKNKYNKLALHFIINDLNHAKGSVDRRMIHEIHNGIRALEDNDDNECQAIIHSNAGGPYGSEVLDGIQADSDQVWKDNVVSENPVVGQDWFKATIQINAHPTEPWTAQAIRPDGSLGTKFTFERRS